MSLRLCGHRNRIRGDNIELPVHVHRQLGYCHRRLVQGELTRAVFTTVQIFWYFVVLLWPVLYGLVYVA